MQAVIRTFLKDLDRQLHDTGTQDKTTTLTTPTEEAAVVVGSIENVDGNNMEEMEEV